MSPDNGLLLDTNVILWILKQEDSKFSKRAAKALSHPDKDFLVSVVSLWEIMIKRHAGKLMVDKEAGEIIDIIRSQRTWHILSLEARHIQALNEIARFSDHADPFDRMLIAQAHSEGLRIVTSDEQFSRYDVDVVW